MLIPRKYRPHLLTFVLLIAALAILSYSASRVSVRGFLHQAAVEITAPVAGIVNIAINGVADFWRRYLLLVGTQEENRRLREENVALNNQLNMYREGYHESVRLRDLLEIKDALSYRSLAARVLDNKSGALFKTILINRGSEDGLRAGYPVVSARGVVGRIVESSWHYARVLLLTDKNSHIDAIIQRNRAQGILQGTGKSQCSLKYIPHSEEALQGDVLVSYGLAGLFPKGLLLGTVARTERREHELFQEIHVTPAVDFRKLEEVLVLIPLKENER
jgi:rod shape-determining protein MreC